MFALFVLQRVALLQQNFEKSCNCLADINHRYSECNPYINTDVGWSLCCTSLQKYFLVIKWLVFHFVGVHMMLLRPYLRPVSHWSHVRKLLLSLVHSYSNQHPASEQHSVRTSWMLLTPPTPGTLWHMTAEIFQIFEHEFSNIFYFVPRHRF